MSAQSTAHGIKQNGDWVIDMEEKKTCSTCKYCENGVCMIPIYVDADFSPARETKPENGCYMHEPKPEH